MKALVDISKLEAEGTITPQQAVQIRRAAAADTGTLAINVIATIGAFAVVAGLLAMRPTSVQVAVIGLGLTFAGVLIRKHRAAQLGFLGSSLVVIGAALLAAGLVLKCSDVAPRTSGFLFACPTTPKWYGHMVLFLVASAWLLAVGALAQNGLLVVLSAFALAGALGSSTGYFHATYMLMMTEPTILSCFLLCWPLRLILVSNCVGPAYERLGIIAARMSLVLVNFGFWIGSL
jgi:iron complex transport system permease protein